MYHIYWRNNRFRSSVGSYITLGTLEKNTKLQIQKLGIGPWEDLLQ